MFLNPSKSSKFGLLACAAATLTACGGAPMLRGATAPGAEVQQTMPAASIPPLEREGTMSMVLLTPMGLPAEIRDQKVSLRLEPGATVQDLVAALAAQGIPIIIADKDAGGRPFYLPRYEGSVGNLVQAIGRTVDVFFSWHNGLVAVQTKERFVVSIPQEEKLAEAVKSGVVELGGVAVSHSGAGMLVFDSSPSSFEQIKLFIERLTNNSALVTLEVALLTVSLNDDMRRGVDWESFTLTLGKNSASRLAGLGDDTDTGTDTGTGTGTGTGTDTGTDTGTGDGTGTLPAPGAPLTSFANLAGGSLSGSIFGNYISVSSVLNLLDKYGATETLQHVRTKTLTGHEAELSSVTEIPYIKSVGATSSAGTGSAVVTGSSESAIATDGITFKLLPTYDRDANTVTVSLDLSVNSVIGFNTLSAGNQIGELTQPTTAKRTLNDILRLRPGQTAVIGGVIFETLADTRTALGGLRGLEGRVLSKKRQELFIVVRPTVSQFGRLEQRAAGAVPTLLPTSQDGKPFSGGSGDEGSAPILRTPGGVPVQPLFSGAATPGAAPAAPAASTGGANGKR